MGIGFLSSTTMYFDNVRHTTAHWLATLILYIKSAIQRKIINIGVSLWRNIDTLQNKLEHS